MSAFKREDSRGEIKLTTDRDITLESDRDQDGAGDLIFRTGGVERARISAAGVGSGWPSVLGGSRAALGLYLPNGWNTNWLAKLALTSSQLVRLALVGDSITQGYYSSDLGVKGWAQLLTTDLQAIYGDGGSGFKSATLCDAFATAASIPAGAKTRYATHGYNTQAGTWARDNSVGEGPGGAYAMTSIDSGTPASMTFAVRGTTVRIYTKSNGGANAAWQYKIDGAAAVPVADGAGANIQVTTITGLAAGAHTVQVIYNDAGVKTLWLIGVAAENATGLVVNNYGIFGAQSSSPGQSTLFTDSSKTADWMGGFKYPADLAVYALGVNDANVSVATETYIQRVRRWTQAIREGGATALDGSCDIAFVMPHAGSYDDTSQFFQNYGTYLRGVAEAYGAALLDFWALGRNSYTKWANLSYWGNPNDPTTSGGDNIHPNDAGHAYMESIIKPLILGTYIG